MNRILVSIIIFIAITSCRGAGRGPLINETFEDEPIMPSMVIGHGRPAVDRIDARVTPCADCITIGNLVANKKDFDGKVISVRGVAARVNDEIMGRNWVHIQDGTEANGVFNLTVTTNQHVESGSVVTLKGTIAIDKDFGFGYFYDIIMEDAQIIR